MLQALKALADANRLKILRLLVDGDLCVGALAARLGVSKPAVSQHLRALRRAGLVRGQKRGYWTHYGVDRQALARIAVQLNALATGEDSPRIPKETDMGRNGCPAGIPLRQTPEDRHLEHRCRCYGDDKAPKESDAGRCKRKRDLPSKSKA